MKKNTNVLIAVAALVATTANPCAASEMDNGMLEHERGHYVAALDHFRRAADDGDHRAQEMLGFMRSLGPALYPGIARDRDAALHWFRLAARGGQPVAHSIYCAASRANPASTPDDGFCVPQRIAATRPR